MNDNTNQISHRLIYSSWDFQQALSALTFLLEECEYDKKYSKVEMRRFRCFETTLIVSFARPFKAGRGRENLDLSKVGFVFTEKDLILKNKLIKLRDKVISHSDEEEMHYETYSFIPFDDNDIRMPMMVFNESLYFEESEVKEIEDLLHRINDKLAKYKFGWCKMIMKHLINLKHQLERNKAPNRYLNFKSIKKVGGCRLNSPVIMLIGSNT